MVVLQACDELGMLDLFDIHAFGRIRETHIGAFKGFLKYDGPSTDPNLSMDLLCKGRDLVFSMFTHYFDSCPLTPDDEVEFPTSTHPGVEYRGLGFKRKGNVIKDPSARSELLGSWRQTDYPTLWKCAVKGGELLKRKKIDSGDARVFLIPGLKFHFWSCKLFQSQHELFKKLGKDVKFPFKIGFSFQNGGYSNLISALLGYHYIGEGDATKWDSSWLPWIAFNVVLPLRCLLFEPTQDCSREEFRERLFFHYFDVLFTLVVLPNGQVMRKSKGMPSGFLLTGDDNSLTHWFIVCMLYVILGKESQFSKDRWFVVADDHIFGTNDPEIAKFENRERVYKMFGVTLTREKDFVSSSADGHTFLGFEARPHELMGIYVPVYSFEKALCSALKPGGKLSPGLRYVRLAALRFLCFFHPHYEAIKSLARQFYDPSLSLSLEERGDMTEDEMYFMLGFPTDKVLQALWLGLECGGLEGILKQNSPHTLVSTSFELLQIPNH